MLEMFHMANMPSHVMQDIIVHNNDGNLNLEIVSKTDLFLSMYKVAVSSVVVGLIPLHSLW